MSQRYSLSDLQYLMARLRDPQTGCPWDLKQTYQSIAAHTLEEVYEVVDAIDRNDLNHLQEELGDLLFQIIFYCQLARETEQFDFDQVVDQITAKLISRHPHVFPEGTLQSVRSADIDEQSIHKNWEQIKQQERQQKGKHRILDDVPQALPALGRAVKLQKRAAGVGFDWSDTTAVIAKVREELDELEQEIAAGTDQSREEELGDLLFSCVNLARHLSADPERALSLCNRKFVRRFERVEEQLDLAHRSYSLEELDQAWQEAKKTEQKKPQ